MMRAWTILIAACFVMQPLMNRAACTCMDRAQSECASASVAAETSCCALRIAADTESQRAPMDTPEPCDDCDCPLSCCGLSKAPITLSAATIEVTSDAFTLVVPISAQDSAASAHLHRLKRPPRLLTTL